MAHEPMSDETLMAYADGELDPAAAGAVERAATADPIVGARIAAFRASREAARDAFAEVLAEAPPPRLVAALDAAERREGRDDSSMARQAAPARGGAAARRRLRSGRGHGDRAGWTPRRARCAGGSLVAAHLPDLMSGSEIDIATNAGAATLRVVGAYKAGARLCRSFALTSDAGVARGVGCGDQSGWTVEVMIAAAASGSDFTTASDAAVAEIDALLDRLDAEGPLDTEEESALAAGG